MSSKINLRKPAPIVVFGYNRLDKFITVIESLKRNQESEKSELWIFIDGPRNLNDSMIQHSILNYAKDINGFEKNIVIHAGQNKGLSKSIEEGISKVLETNSSLIVIEDDIKVSKYFLEYINLGLFLYEQDENVASIHGYSYPTKNKLPNTFFLKGADCWGWGTWRRSWDKYNKDSKALLQSISIHKDKNDFDFSGYGGFIKMLKDSVKGKNDSWAIKWYASMFLSEMYTLYPGESLVENIGLDGSGAHKEINETPSSFDQNQKIKVEKIEVKESKIAREAFIQFFKQNNTSQIYKNLNSLLNFKKNVT